MKPRTMRLIGLLETYSSEDLQREFVGRMAYGESFRHVCDSKLIPYNMTAEIIGWDRISKTFGEPYRPQAPTIPPKTVKPAISLPPPDDGNDYRVL